MATSKKKVEKKKEPDKFSKADFLASQSYKDKRDMIEAVWQGEEMSVQELSDKLEKFMKGSVK